MSSKTRMSVVQQIVSAGIWYIESQNSHIFVGIVKKENGQLSLRAAIAESIEIAGDLFEVAGEVLYAVSLIELLSHIIGELDPQPGANTLIL